MPRRTYTPKHSTVIAYLALFSSLGTGGAFAATQLAKNSVGSRQIRTGAVQLSDLSPAALRALRGKVGPAGPAGSTGPVGATGAPGQVSTANIVQREATGPLAATPTDVRSVSVKCAIDEQLLGGGGAYLSGSPDTPALLYSGPTLNAQEWDVAFARASTIGRARAYAICLKP